MGVKYAIRYMDDIVILSESKAWLHQLRKEIEKYLITNLKLEIKDNWQVFPSRVRGIDFVGYRHFGDYILLRKSTATRLMAKPSRCVHQRKSFSSCNRVQITLVRCKTLQSVS